MKRSPFLRLQNVALSFPVRVVGRDKELACDPRIANGLKSVLKNISLSVKPGDRIGLIGLNGSGKTTLLRLLNGVYQPDSGRFYRRGTVASMINATLGMDQNLSAYKNAVFRARLKGCDRKTAENIAADIAEFTELGANMYLPLKTYSAGMIARFGFAVATSFPADITLMDEWLAAGDARFHERALERMQGFLSSERILVLASHSDGMIQNWCNKVLVLHEGEQVAFTDVFSGIRLKRQIAMLGSRALDEGEVGDELPLPMPGLFDGHKYWCSSSIKSALEVPDLPKNIRFDGERDSALIDGDYAWMGPKHLIEVEPDGIYRVRIQVRQVRNSANGRPSGVYCGFIGQNESHGLATNAYNVNVGAADLREHHGLVTLEYDIRIDKDSDIKYLRPYAGCNYAGSQPHADGAAELHSFKVFQVIN